MNGYSLCCADVDLYIPAVFSGIQFSAKPRHQSASMTRGFRVHSRLYYAGCHTPGEGSKVRGRRRLPGSSSFLQAQQTTCETLTLKSHFIRGTSTTNNCDLATIRIRVILLRFDFMLSDKYKFKWTKYYRDGSLQSC